MSDGYIERQKIRDLSRQARDVFRAESRSELLRETVREAIASLPEIKRPPKVPHFGVSDNKTLVVGIGDLHYGANIRVEGLFGDLVNSYNSDVYETRMELLFYELAAICDKEKVSEITLFMVGDLLEGMIHRSQLMKLEYGLIESAMRLSEHLSNWIARLSEVARVSVYACSGNHSEIRPLGSKKGEFEEENLERIVMWYLAERLKDVSGVYIDPECRKMKFLPVQGFNFLLFHGDGEKKISEIAKATINQYGETIDFFVCGHAHCENEFPSGMTSNGDSVIIRVPSVCGVSQYAQNKGYNGKAGAVATLIERDYGRRCVYPIRLQ